MTHTIAWSAHHRVNIIAFFADNTNMYFAKGMYKGMLYVY